MSQCMHWAEFFYSVVEINLGIICGGMTTIPIFFRHHQIKMLGLNFFDSIKFRTTNRSEKFKLADSSTAPENVPKTRSIHKISSHIGNPNHLEPEDISNFPLTAHTKFKARDIESY